MGMARQGLLLVIQAALARFDGRVLEGLRLVGLPEWRR
jgi:hypothetical protein